MGGNVWIVAEHREGRLHPAMLELATLGREIAAASGGGLRAVVLGAGAPVADLANEIAQGTGLDVLALRNEHLAPYRAEAYQAALGHLAGEGEEACFLIPPTSTGADYAPGLAVRLGAYAVSGAADVEVGDPEGAVFVRPICNGKLLVRLRPAPGRSAVVTVAAGARPAAPPVAVPGRVEVRDVDVPAPRVRRLGLLPAPPREIDLGRAEVIVAGGRGVGSRDGMRLLEEVASCFDRGVVAGSRTACDRGWLPPDRQVGSTGQTVSPRLYFACGISGAVQHLTGMNRSGCVVAINTDRQAPIFSVAHLGVVADLHAFLPILARKLRPRGAP